MSDARDLLAATVDRLLAERVTQNLLESAERGEWPAALWEALEENGLTRPLVDEAQGGAGVTWDDAYVIVRAAGRHAAPVPLAETIVASALLAGAGLEVPAGPLTLAPPMPADASPPRRESPRLSGTFSRVPWGRVASHLVATRRDGDGGARVALLPLAPARITPGVNLALEPRDTVEVEAAPLIVAPRPAASADVVLVLGAVARAAQMAGALDGILALGIRYAGERKQFGRPLGAFQAIQHQLAVLAGHAAAAGVAAAGAFRAADRTPVPWVDAAAAKIRAGEAAGVGAGIAHQVHGAIGFTYEHTLHFLTRRLWSWRAEFGAEGEWAARLGRSVCARGADHLWPDLTAGWREVPAGP
jgi:acyl-CoA dehydrogenase